MKYIISILAVIIIIFILFYGGYYLVFPSLQGEDILENFNMPYPTVVAHRGSSGLAPESTVEAYKRAVKNGTDYLEADLRQTKDGKIVVFHDNTLKRTSNVAKIYPEKVEDKVHEFKLEELKKLDTGSWFNKKYPQKSREEYENLEIITLEELIEIAKSGDHKPGLILELKDTDNHENFEKNIIKVLRDNNYLNLRNQKASSQVIFFSFNLDSLKKLKKLVPEHPRLLLIDDQRISRDSWENWLDKGEGIVNGIGTKGWTCWPWHIAKAHDRGIFVFPYTVNKTWQMQILSHFKADGYITDYPESTLMFLERISQLPEIDESVKNEEILESGD